MTPFEITRGDGPIVLGLPHTGTFLPQDVMTRLNETGRAMADTDWHIHTLYDGLLDGVSSVRATFHRYLIDANRDPSGASLYPGQNTTTLCPLTDFDGTSIYRDGQAPDAAEIDRRHKAYHAPYHAALQAELARVQALHGVVVLYDCHSIRSHIPFLFDGILPDFNIGTNGTTTCAPAIEQAVQGICARAAGFSHVLNGRFKGGWTTRHYGRPESGVHVIQMELAQKTYMRETAPWTYETHRAEKLRAHLKTILQSIETLALSGALSQQR